jgi:hypothetical protein
MIQSGPLETLDRLAGTFHQERIVKLIASRAEEFLRLPDVGEFSNYEKLRDLIRYRERLDELRDSFGLGRFCDNPPWRRAFSPGW